MGNLASDLHVNLRDASVGSGMIWRRLPIIRVATHIGQVCNSKTAPLPARRKPLATTSRVLKAHDMLRAVLAQPETMRCKVPDGAMIVR